MPGQKQGMGQKIQKMHATAIDQYLLPEVSQTPQRTDPHNHDMAGSQCQNRPPDCLKTSLLFVQETGVPTVADLAQLKSNSPDFVPARGPDMHPVELTLTEN